MKCDANSTKCVKEETELKGEEGTTMDERYLPKNPRR